MVFEHVGAQTFNGSLLCLKRGGHLVTCGSTSGPSTTLNLMQLFSSNTGSSARLEPRCATSVKVWQRWRAGSCL